MSTCTISTFIQAKPELVWECFTEPKHIIHWNQADASWHCPKAENDLRVGGRFCFTMAAKDGSTQFDFTGLYLEVEPMKKIRYLIDDGRLVEAVFTAKDHGVHITESFETEPTHSVEQQQSGWQSILDSFNRYVITLAS